MRDLNLSKKVVADVSLQKGLDGHIAKVVLVLDISGSMSSLYHSGYVQDVLERIAPLAMQFDDDQAFELYLFSDNVKQANNVTLNNLSGFVRREIIGSYAFGGTNYSPAIEKLTRDYGGAAAENSGGFFGKLFGKSAPATAAGTPQHPAYVIFVTDGDNYDRSATEKAIIEASKRPLFFQFVGIGNERFSFLQKLDDLSGRTVDNAGFFSVQDLTKISDQDLYSKLLNEYPTWLKAAKGKGIL